MRIDERVRLIVAEKLAGKVNADTLTLDDDLWAAGMTSLESVTVIVAIEDSFGIEFADEHLERERFRTCRAIGEAVTLTV